MLREDFPDLVFNTEQAKIRAVVNDVVDTTWFLRDMTTQDQMRDCLKSASDQDKLVQFEVETYAWDVLPAELQHENVAIGIAEEMRWLAQVFTE